MRFKHKQYITSIYRHSNKFQKNTNWLIKNHNAVYFHSIMNTQKNVHGVQCSYRALLDLVKTTNTCTWLYHSFIQYTGCYMFRQWSAIIRELLGSVLVTWNAVRIGGISSNVCLYGLCAGVLWPHKHTLYGIPPIRFVLQVTQTDPRSSLMMADHCRNMQQPVYWIKEWYNQVHVLVVFATLMYMELRNLNRLITHGTVNHPTLNYSRCPAACVFAQQYSSPTLNLSCFLSRKITFVMHFKNDYYFNICTMHHC
jgi:hypothetical protein